MMQVAAEDTHDNYVICRGYDPRVKKFFDYVEDDADKVGIPVAKPWNHRGAGAYTVGHVFPAVIPLTRIGQTSGVRDPGDDEENPLLGQPEDLDEEVEILYTDEEDESERKVVNWLLLEAGGTTLYEILDLGPQWDNEEKAYKVQGRIVPDEKADGTMFDIDEVDDENKEWLWFPRKWSWDDGTTRELPFYYEYKRVHAITRNGKKEISGSLDGRDIHWLPSAPLTGLDGEMPAYSACQIYAEYPNPDLRTSYDDDRKTNIRTRMYQPGFEHTNHGFALSGPIATDDYDGNTFIPVTQAKDRPAWAFYDESVHSNYVDLSTDEQGKSWGPAHNSWYLWPGLPGFRLLINKSGTNMVYVIADMSGIYTAKVISWSTPTTQINYYNIVANPTTMFGGRVYDGTTQNSVTYPEMEIDIRIPSVYYTVSQLRSPNLLEGDEIYYRATWGVMNTGETPRPQYIAEGDYMDEPIGTVKMWTGSVASIPRGWQVYSALDGKFPLGDNSGTLDSGTFGTSGSDYSYQEVRFIERYA